MDMHIVGQVLDSKLKISLLGMLLERKDAFSVSELSRLAGLPKATISTIIVNWEKTGLVTTEYQGRNKNTRLNQKFYLLPEIRKMYKKAKGFNKPLFDMVLSLQSVKDKRVKAAVVFGSRARTDFEHSSDVDVMIGFEDEIMPLTEELSREFAKLSANGGIRFSPHFYGKSDILNRLKSRDNLMENILKEAIILKGREWIEGIQASS